MRIDDQIIVPTRQIVEGAERFLRDFRGYEILKDCGSLEPIDYPYPRGTADYVARIGSDEPVIAFVYVTAREGYGDEQKLDRGLCERYAYLWLASHPEISECHVRFDAMTMCFTGERAFVAYHECVNGGWE